MRGMQRRTVLIIIIIAAVAAVVGASLIGSILTIAGSAPSFDAASSTYEFMGDTFTLHEGKASIMGHPGLPGTGTSTIPMGYTLAASSTGDITGNSSHGAAAVLYRNFGANLQWLTLFGFEARGGKYAQVASSTIYKSDASVQSVSIDKGVVTVNFLVVSAADQKLPHYQQSPTQPLSLRFKLTGDSFTELP